MRLYIQLAGRLEMELIGARHALLERGWKQNVLIAVEDGRVHDIGAWKSGQAGVTAMDLVIPGMCNAHSHSFQRAFAGLAERRSAKGEDFWSWRERMYATAERIGLEELRIISARLYAELLLRGYTHVAEFHYLHRPGTAADPLEAAAAICSAAADSGIGLTFLPVLYRWGDFGRKEPGDVQRRFTHDCRDYCALVSRVAELCASRGVESGIAFHSLRAVETGDITEVLETLGDRAGRWVKHVHIAEQQREVERSLAVLGRSPINALLEAVAVDASWSLVHATHADAAELDAIAQSGATVVLCPTTEANLGDGIFPLEDYLATGGALAIGSDSHVALDPAEELRMLEYSVRLEARRRLIAASEEHAHTGTRLWSAAAAGGARSCGIEAGVIAKGMRADLVSIDAGNPQFAGRTPDEILDTFIFGGAGQVVRDVMVAGHWRVRNFRLERGDDFSREYAWVLARLHGGTVN